MARKSKWTESDRRTLLKLIKDGVPEQEIREKLGGMSSPVFAQQLKIAMVEAGQIKQAAPAKKAAKKVRSYGLTAKGRLTIPDFSERTDSKAGDKFTLEKPRGKSNAWRLVPAE